MSPSELTFISGPRGVYELCWMNSVQYYYYCCFVCYKAFRHMSHKFHGKGSGRKKTEKRVKKLQEEFVSSQFIVF